jgi:hypothetical protein
VGLDGFSSQLAYLRTHKPDVRKDDVKFDDVCSEDLKQRCAALYYVLGEFVWEEWLSCSFLGDWGIGQNLTHDFKQFLGMIGRNRISVILGALLSQLGKKHEEA